MAGDDQDLGHPKQRVDFDLSKDTRYLREKGFIAPELQPINSDRRTPEDLMRLLGFDPTTSMTPIQFLLAVMNDDLSRVFKNENRRKRMEGKGGLSIQYRLEAAKTAAKYLHMEMPKSQITKTEEVGFGDQLSSAIQSGNKRVVHRQTIIQEIERISPDIPLAPASYPPNFMDAELNDVDEAMEGDTDYDPDRDDSSDPFQ